MPPVPSTSTATDALLERKKILEGNAVLIGRRDEIKQDLELHEIALNAAKQELKSVTGLSLTTEDLHDLTSGALLEKRKALRGEIESLEERKRLAIVDADTTGIRRNKSRNEAKSAEESAKTALEGMQKAQDDQSAANTALEATKTAHGLEMARLATERSTAQTELNAMRKEYTEKKNLILTESARLARRGSDLAIYEERVRKIAAGTGVEIVL